MIERWVGRMAVAIGALLGAFAAPMAGAHTPITSGETVTAGITVALPQQDYTFSATAGDTIVIRVGEVAQTGTFTPRIRLFSPTNALLATASGAVAAEISVTAAATGLFSITVDDAVTAPASATFRLSLFASGVAVAVTPGDEGGALVNGALQTGTIDVGDLDVWTITANVGDAIVVRAGEVSAGSTLTPWLRLYTPAGALVDSSASAAAAEVATTASSAGTYVVVIGDGTGGLGGSGAYRLTLAKTGAAVVVTAGDDGGPLTNGAVQTGTIDVGDLDVWTITANVGDAIVVRMGETSVGSPLTPWLRLYSPSGALLANSFSAAAAEVTTTAASAGTYVVVAGDGTSGLVGSGGYRITLAKTGDPVTVSVGDEGGPLTNGAVQTGAIDVGDLDVWTVTASVGDAIVVRAGEISSGSSLTPWVRIYSPAGALLDSSFAAAAAEVTTTAASSGTYLVVVGDGTSGLAGSGPYRLTLAKTGSAVVVSPGDEGGPLTNGAVQTGSIDVGDLDVWTISATVGDAIVVRMGEVSSGSSLTPWLRIYSPSGALLGNSFAAAAAEVTTTAASSGTYIVVAGDGTSGLAGSGPYRLTLAKTGSAVTISPSDEGGPLVNGAMHTGAIEVGDLDVWTFSANPGDALLVRMGEVASGSTLTPWVRLYSPAGALLASSFAAAAAEVTATAASAGTYVVVVGDGTSGLVGSGAYRLSLAKTGAKVTVSPGDEGGPLPTGITLASIVVGDLDAWTIGAHAGDTINVTMDEIASGGPLTPWLRLYSPAGALLQSNFGAATAQVSVVAASTGTYLLVAGDGTSGLAGNGAYRLTKAAGPATNADLADLSIAPGTLAPAFATNTLAYTATVVSNTNTLAVTPTLADLTSTVTVNGVVVASGDASGPVTLVEGVNPISVVVTAQDGVTTKTYTISVTFLPASSCVYSLSPSDLSNQPAGGGIANVVVTMPAPCPLPVVSYQPWVTLNGITPNGATTTVALQIGANAGPARATSIVLADRLFLITQLAP